MSDVVLRVENLGKKYILGHQRSGDLREDFGKKIRSLFTNNNSEKEEFWALKNVSFDIKKGEAVGIIGRNGAGKSTLLKILSRITAPSTGRFEITGRVSSLLEVGTGFHSELTGRENIFLNGTILGMRRAEIKARFDEIVAFSGIEKFIDTSVKHYSSGMKVRLAFSVAAHLEPEILIVDEVLAVGDVEFQKKCLGKMDEVSKGEGRTVLFVSHNLGAVNQLCQTGILLLNGEIREIGEMNQVVNTYLLNNKKFGSGDIRNITARKGNGYFRVVQIDLLNDELIPVQIGRTGENLIFKLELNQVINLQQANYRFDFAIDSEQDLRIGWFSSSVIPVNFKSESNTVYLKLPKFAYGKGTYSLTFYFTCNGDVVDYIHQAFLFDIEEGDFFETGQTIPGRQTFFYHEHEIFN